MPRTILFMFALLVTTLEIAAPAQACDRPLSSAFDQIGSAPIAVVADVRRGRRSARHAAWNARVVRAVTGAPGASIALETRSMCALTFRAPGRYLLLLTTSGAGVAGYDSAFADPSSEFVDALVQFRDARTDAARADAVVTALAAGDETVRREAVTFLHLHPGLLRAATLEVTGRAISTFRSLGEEDASFAAPALAMSGEAGLVAVAERLNTADDVEGTVRVLECATRHAEGRGTGSSLARRWRGWIGAGGARVRSSVSESDMIECVAADR